MAVFEIKDGNLSSSSFHVDDGSDGSVLTRVDSSGRHFIVRDNPVEKIELYKMEILELYCPRLSIRLASDPTVRASVTAGIVIVGSSTDQACAALKPFRDELGHLDGRAPVYYPVSGSDALEKNRIDVVFPEHSRVRSKHMSEDLARDLRSWLIEPDYSVEQRRPITLDGEQRKVVGPVPEKTGMRRVRGPAGSGKSVALATKAAQSALSGRDVLVTSFNITMLNYLKDIASRSGISGRRMDERLTWCNFHEWCRRVCYTAGFGRSYRALWKAHFDGCFSLDEVLNIEVPRLTASAVEASPIRYDLILLDEAQDFLPYWWDVLRMARYDDGEMLLVADATQDLFGRSEGWTESRMIGAGLHGPWMTLDKNYRLPSTLVPFLRVFVDRYLPELDVNLPIIAQADLFTKLRWVQVHRESSLASLCAEVAMALPRLSDPGNLALSDITLLTSTRGTGLACVRSLEARGIRTSHTFGHDKMEERGKKRYFYMGGGRVKATTFHSFRGWESRALVIGIEHAKTVADYAAIYVALSRLKQHDQGSYMVVVCKEPSLTDFGSSWPDYLDWQSRTDPAADSLGAAG